MADAALIAKAERFRQLHADPAILVLPNAWDVASALILQDAGAAAIGTTSAGIAYTVGLPDGEAIAPGEMLAAVGRIARRLSIPVTADVEAGYGPAPEDVARTIEGVIAAGAVGVNLEDGIKRNPPALRDRDDMIARLSAARGAADNAGVPVVINARTDGFLFGIGAPEDRVALSVERGNAYLAAGADTIFVPGAVGPDDIGALVAGIDGPVNLLAVPGLPDVPRLQELGVVRVSVGSGIAHATLGATRRIARAMLEDGTFEPLFDGAPKYPEVNALMKGG